MVVGDITPDTSSRLQRAIPHVSGTHSSRAGILADAEAVIQHHEILCCYRGRRLIRAAGDQTVGESLLVGRSAECARVEELVANTRRGDGGALVIRGEPGIGKTALLEHALVESGGMGQLRTAGVEAEYELPFSALSQVVGPVLNLLPLVPDFPRAALEGALGLGPPVDRSDFAPSVATLMLLSEAASQSGGLLCVVDDAHRIDAASAKVLTFVARRIGADSFSILFAARTGELTSFDASGIATIDLAPLEATDALAVLLAATRDEIASEVAATLVTLSGGNPLALRELPTLLDVDQLSGRSPLPEPLPAGRGVLDAFIARIKRLERTTQSALLVVAASHDGDSAIVASALDELAYRPRR